jgi:hypothetical protein
LYLNHETAKKVLQSSATKNLVKQALRRSLPVASTLIKRDYRTDFPNESLPPNTLLPDERRIPRNIDIKKLYNQKKTTYPIVMDVIKCMAIEKGEKPFIALAQGTESPEKFLEEMDKHPKIATIFQMLTQKDHKSYLHTK